MGYIGLALCEHDNSDKLYLFRCVTGYGGVSEGDRVVVDTAKGHKFATVVNTTDVYEDSGECAMILALAGVGSVADLRRVLQKVTYKNLKYEEDE